MKKDKRHHIIIITLLLTAVVIIAFALPRHSSMRKYNYEVGQPWSYPTLIAPFDFPKEFDAKQAAQITDSVKAAYVPIFERNGAGMEQTAKLARMLSERTDVPPVLRQQIITAVQDVYSRGIVSNETYAEIASGKLPQVRFLSDNGVAELHPTNEMLSGSAAYSLLDSTVVLFDGQRMMGRIGLNDYLSPNVVPDKEENDKYLQTAINDALSVKGYFVKGEAIIYQGRKVHDEEYTYLQTYERLMKEREDQNGSRGIDFLGLLAMVAILLAMFYVFMRLIRPRLFAQMKRMVFLISFITLWTVAVYLLAGWDNRVMYLIPFAVVPIFVTTFYDTRTSFFIHMVTILLCSLVAADRAEFIYMQFLAGGIAVVSMQELTKRSQLVRCSFFIFLAYCIVFVALQLMRGIDLQSINWKFLSLFAVNCVVLSFAYFGIFIVEKLFGFTSTVTLVELSDINTPLLRELAEACPGTFQHVLQVANIAQEAALKVGANIQLVRAGALYHDIGKIGNPAFFIENQSGVNPHDALDPEQSAHIIIGHVNDGLRRADKARLPQVIRDLIAQHHGTSIVRYFYAQACQQAGEKVDPAPYTYPGPNPQTREAAILMMADSCEAAAKSLKQYSESNIKAMVEKVIDQQVTDGLFREAPISFRDVETVKQVFSKRLCAFYHTRISYPEANNTPAE